MTRPRTNGKSRESRRLAKERDYGSLKNMPPLRIKKEDGSFDLSDCELIDWMVEQPDVRQFLINCARNSGFIRYDTNEKVWIGIDY